MGWPSYLLDSASRVHKPESNEYRTAVAILILCSVFELVADLEVAADGDGVCG